MDEKEIDRQIAEKVMGWKYHEHHHTQLQFPSPAKGWINDYGNVRSITDWQPSTNIAHAFGVRDKIKSMRFSARMKFKKALQQMISYRVFKDDSVEDWEGDGVKTLSILDMSEIIIWVQPEDICLAALEAVKG